MANLAFSDCLDEVSILRSFVDESVQINRFLLSALLALVSDESDDLFYGRHFAQWRETTRREILISKESLVPLFYDSNLSEGAGFLFNYDEIFSSWLTRTILSSMCSVSADVFSEGRETSCWNLDLISKEIREKIENSILSDIPVDDEEPAIDRRRSSVLIEKIVAKYSRFIAECCFRKVSEHL